MDKIEIGEYVRLDDGTIGTYNINKNWINVVKTNNKDIGFEIKQEKPKSKWGIGNITIYHNRTFNWLQRKMWKIFFGTEITNLED